MYKVCRFCTLNCTTLEDIFGEQEQTDNEPLLIVMLESCTNCDIRKSDTLPQNICGPCRSAVKSAYQFKMKCEQSQQYFKELLTECEVKSEIVEFITDDWLQNGSNLGEICTIAEPDEPMDEILEDSEESSTVKLIDNRNKTKHLICKMVKTRELCISLASSPDCH